MKSIGSVFRFFAGLIVFIFCFAACRLAGPDPLGIWKGTVRNPSGEQVAFTLEVTREGNQYRGALVNGDDRTPSTAGSWDGRTLKLKFDYYDGELAARIAGDKLEGEFVRQWQKQILKREFRGERASQGSRLDSATGVDLSGDWVLQVGVQPNVKFWRAAFRRQGGALVGTLIPVSGDWGQFTGTLDGDRLLLNRFDGINSRLLKARVRPDGRIEGLVDLGLFDPVRPVVGERLDQGNRESVANLPDPGSYTRMKNPAEPFRFSFPDLSGQTVSSTDARFKNKVVVISITGSWCPNCHEESPLMQQYYERYREQGLEVVALAFEYTGDWKRDLEQLKIFGNRHKLTYPLLLAGSTEEGEIERKLPQLVNFGAYPTTIFIGRDGLVRRIHTGFEGKATGERHLRLKTEYEELIRQLLAERESSSLWDS